MSFVFLLLCMIFCHIIADFNLQGWLASAKQKSYWEVQTAGKKKYKYDYIPALLTHSFSWTFVMMLPIVFVNDFNINWIFVVAFIVNIIIHTVVDDLKANKKKINLWQDQLIHIVQIVITAFIFK